MEYLLIDGNNLAIRCAFANEYMTNKDGVSSGAHYGFFNSLLNLKNRFPESQMLVAWDSSSIRRKEESKNGVESGIVKEAYKENRKKEDPPTPLADWFATGDHLKKALDTVGIPQIRINGYEADDVIASYCNHLKDHKVVIVSSDKDFYQLLDDHVIVWDGMKEDFITGSSFKEEFGINPEQHVDVGALMGDIGDNIFGIPGWGPKTAISAIQEFGTWEKVIENLEQKYKSYREAHPDYSDEGDEIFSSFNPNVEPSDRKSSFLKYKELKTDKGGTVYPEIYWGQPYSGLLDILDNKKLKIQKKDVMAMMFKDRVRLAYSLKKMDRHIMDLPDIRPLEKNKERLLEYFAYYNIVSLKERIDKLF